MKIYIETLGCPKNVWDSQWGITVLEKSNYKIVDQVEEADVIIVNTCGFINDAKEESIDTILALDEIKNKNSILLVSGCLSERYREDLFKAMPEIDIITGVNDYFQLPDLIEKYKKEGRFFSFSHEEVLSKEYIASGEIIATSGPVSAYLKIAEGCDSFCSYCVIPFIRGRYVSRKIEDIVDDAKQMAAHGIKEIILIAQDLCYYGKDLYGERSLARLLKDLCTIDDIKWIRLMYCYEDGITDELISVIAENEQICPYIDIPIQHSENEILEAMNRNSTKDSIKNTIERLRNRIPNIHIRTTLLSGFPGETEKDAEGLEEFIKEMKFERLGVFAFSKEEGTLAYDMSNHIPEDLIDQRRDRLMSIQKDISLELNEAKVGSTIEVLVEEIEENIYIGRSCFDAPEIDNSVSFTSSYNPMIGDFVLVEIDEAWEYDIFGKEVRSEK